MIVQDGVLSSLDLADFLRKSGMADVLWKQLPQHHWQASPHLLRVPLYLLLFVPMALTAATACPPPRTRTCSRYASMHISTPFDVGNQMLSGNASIGIPQRGPTVCLLKQPSRTDSRTPSNPEPTCTAMADVDTPPPAEKKEEVVLGEDGQVNSL